MAGLFITATGTDIGKTYVTARIVKKLREAGINAGYYKAALSGAEWIDGKLVPGDAAYVAKISNLKDEPSSLVSYIYETAVSPHLAALREGNPLDLKVVKEDYAKSESRFDLVTVEGSGGIICPIRYDEFHILLEDIIKTLGLGTIIVSNAALGSINACVLTIHYLRAKNIPIHGIILNNYDETDFMQADNRKMMEEISGIPVVGIVKQNGEELEMDLELLKSFYK
ncbi:MAG: dethiobiotin synthase [Phascolarctobacterium sp.]|nr:dethiobiotin synthase [Phascolarctobacterium sp.]